jgi:hypothetical protein
LGSGGPAKPTRPQADVDHCGTHSHITAIL